MKREWTVGEISDRLNEPVHRVEYVIRSRRIAPRSIAGNCRVFDDDAVEQISAVLQIIDAKKKEHSNVQETR
jgi:hypothetical protein